MRELEERIERLERALDDALVGDEEGNFNPDRVYAIQSRLRTLKQQLEREAAQDA